MAKPHSPDRFAVKGLTAEAAIGAEWVAVTRETALPSRFTVRASLQIPHCDVTLLVVVGRHCDLLVKRVAIDVPESGDAELLTSTMRGILVHQLVAMGAELTECPIAELEGPVARTPLDARLLRPRRPRRTTTEKVAEAARLFREAVASGVTGRGCYVADRLGVSESQASRYLAAARQSGLLAEGGPR